MSKVILIVDDEPNNLQVLREILQDDYRLKFANNGSKAIEAAQKYLPDLILLDVMMPDMNGFDVCINLKENPKVQHIPVIFVTAMSDVEDEAKGFDVGAVDFIQKPVSAPIVKRRVKTHLDLVQASTLQKSHRAAIRMLGEAGHFNDTDTGLHIWRMAAYARALAEGLGWDEDEASYLELAATMHDTGKIGIPDAVLKAPRKLEADEWELMKQHTTIGHEILCQDDSPVFQYAAEVALCHHEKWDGSGYPNAISGEDIPEIARIVAIADVFDALTMKRPYKEPWTVEEAIAEIQKGSGSHFDPNLVDKFIEMLPKMLELKEYWDSKPH